MTDLTHSADSNKSKSLNNSQVSNKHTLPIIPLNGAIALPQTDCHLLIGREFSTKALLFASQSKSSYVILLGHDLLNETNQRISAESMHKKGVLARLVSLNNFDKNIKDAHFKVECVCKMEEIHFDENVGYYLGSCVTEIETPFDEKEVYQQMKLVLDTFTKLAQNDSQIPEVVIQALKEAFAKNDISAFVSHLALTFIKDKLIESLLAINNFNKRLDFIYLFLQKRVQSFEIEKQIRARLEKQISQNQEEYIQSERLKVINKISKKTVSETEKYKSKVVESLMSEEAKEKVFEEIEKMENTPSNSPEIQVSRSYIDYLLKLPWGKLDANNFDLTKVEKILSKNHYGLKKIKDRILEHLAVTKRVSTTKAPVLCLVGPPGVGKTSLAQSIAEATGKQYVRMALGGLKDDNEIKGHRRTYIGSMPGKIIQNMIKAKVNNPVFLLDEVDKLSNSVYGDPASALLEVLDPEQNKAFSDYYLDVNYDLSQVMFIATANTFNIPPALLDRMEVIELHSYLQREKLAIAKKHIIPKVLNNLGMKKTEVSFSHSAIEKIVHSYTMEAGVRDLERNINQISRKVLLKIMSEQIKSEKINSENLIDYLGPIKLKHLSKTTKRYIGKVTGLAYNSVGGDLLDIEVVATAGSGKLVYTGKIGSVMQESVKAALTVVKSLADKLNINQNSFEKKDLHVHFPAGAIPKDGPSAGVAVVTAITSALTTKSVSGKIAMTGEVSLHGDILAIGGLQEKLSAAVRGKIAEVILPKDNEKDLHEVDQEIKDKLKIYFAKNVSEVFEQVFP